jgi:hypothetical protein
MRLERRLGHATFLIVERINVGLSSWIIRDGNYEDMAVGEDHRFALEFYAPKELKRKDAGKPGLTGLAFDAYDAAGRVVFVDPRVWVLDCDVLVYREDTPPEQAVIGAVFTGEVRIGIDPFFYKEYLHSVPGMPDLYYDFRIDEILLETTPWKRTGRTLRRQAGKRSFVPVPRTDAWNHDDGRAEYVLCCRILNSAA